MTIIIAYFNIIILWLLWQRNVPICETNKEILILILKTTANAERFGLIIIIFSTTCWNAAMDLAHVLKYSGGIWVLFIIISNGKTELVQKKGRKDARGEKAGQGYYKEKERE